MNHSLENHPPPKKKKKKKKLQIFAKTKHWNYGASVTVVNTAFSLCFILNFCRHWINYRSLGNIHILLGSNYLTLLQKKKTTPVIVKHTQQHNHRIIWDNTQLFTPINQSVTQWWIPYIIHPSIVKYSLDMLAEHQQLGCPQGQVRPPHLTLLKTRWTSLDSWSLLTSGIEPLILWISMLSLPATWTTKKYEQVNHVKLLNNNNSVYLLSSDSIRYDARGTNYYYPQLSQRRTWQARKNPTSTKLHLGRERQ